MANYNTGVTATLTAQPHGTAFTFTVPAGVLTGDVMILSLEVFTQNGSSNSFGTPSSGGGNWSQVGNTLTGTYTGGGTFPVYGFVFWRVATASDPGSTFTMSYTGTTPSPDQVWWSGDFESYTGFYTASPIGNFATFNNGNSTTITAPTTTTTAANSWQVLTCPVAIASSATFATEPLTNRHIANTQGINSSISDSNGSVGASGTTIGGVNWTTQAAVNNSGMAYTIELRTQAPAVAAAAATSAVSRGRASSRQGRVSVGLVSAVPVLPSHVTVRPPVPLLPRGRVTVVAPRPARPVPVRVAARAAVSSARPGRVVVVRSTGAGVIPPPPPVAAAVTPSGMLDRRPGYLKKRILFSI